MEAIAEKYRSLLGLKSRFHNISLHQTLYYFPAALVSSSAEDKGEKGGEKSVWGEEYQPEFYCLCLLENCREISNNFYIQHCTSEGDSRTCVHQNSSGVEANPQTCAAVSLLPSAWCLARPFQLCPGHLWISALTSAARLLRCQVWGDHCLKSSSHAAITLLQTLCWCSGNGKWGGKGTALLKNGIQSHLIFILLLCHRNCRAM